MSDWNVIIQYTVFMSEPHDNDKIRTSTKYIPWDITRIFASLT